MLAWTVAVPAGQSREMSWELRCADRGAVVAAAPERPSWSVPVVTADDRRLAAWVAGALRDLDELRMTSADDVFIAAGAPWFFTLFGRDSLITARMLLPLGTEVAAGTLRALAARQGRRVDPDSAEEPGKILHELRREPVAYSTGLVLPAVYYGTVDATCLWVTLLNDAWRWGMPAEQVADLLPAAVAALEWIGGHAGFLRYQDTSGHGLANQGVEGLRRRDPVRRRQFRHRADGVVRGAGVRVRRGDPRRRVAGRLRSARRRPLAAVGRRASHRVPGEVLGDRRVRAVPGGRAGRHRPIDRSTR